MSHQYHIQEKNKEKLTETHRNSTVDISHHQKSSPIQYKPQRIHDDIERSRMLEQWFNVEWWNQKKIVKAKKKIVITKIRKKSNRKKMEWEIIKKNQF